ncbi:pachytene checkpoint protein 2 homolog isoform X2 [Synchiropus splendidus]|uniref:pachytene checkpoint protein 2 homolog isoform X2 n=1 Tax=Synchiropus splendidus TaxID=270530 RepID=UPI00237E782D|nr:pachytene checkpoint protein 2 homolog isoform X2 [Synchiropus splendidus]
MELFPCTQNQSYSFTRMEMGDRTQNIHVEVCVKARSTAKWSEVKLHVVALMDRHSMVFGNYKWTTFDEEFLANHVESVAIVDVETMSRQPLDLRNCSVFVHIFALHEDGPSTLSLEEDESLSAANHWLLPAVEFHGIWETLEYDDGIKTQLLDYVTTTIHFSDKHVDSNVICWNRVVLLHGPPGTGKTSLCKALAQKLSIRLSNRFSYGQFVEINSHSLFSKWFSESGKLVTKMFQKIQQLVDDKDALVFVLIDEVESLTAARNASQAGTEPSDAIRVVNSVLTQLDQMKRHSNVVILTTSNVTGKIDLAFVDRADIRQFIGLPSEKGIYSIYLSCLEELMKCQIIFPRHQLFNIFELETMDFAQSEVSEHSLALWNISLKSKGLSGRALRKTPFLAHALFVQTPTVTLEMFLEALDLAVKKQLQERDNLFPPQPREGALDPLISSPANFFIPKEKLRPHSLTEL